MPKPRHITVTIPEKLAARIETWKDSYISRIYTRALEAKVAELDALRGVPSRRIGTTFPVSEPMGQIVDARVAVEITCPHCGGVDPTWAMVGVGKAVWRMGNCRYCHLWYSYNLITILGCEVEQATVTPVQAKLSVTIGLAELGDEEE